MSDNLQEQKIYFFTDNYLDNQRYGKEMTLRLRLGRLFLIYIIFQNKNIDNQHSLKYNTNQKQCNEKRRVGYG